MNPNTILLIVALEALAVCVFVILLLIAKNRKLRKLLKALQDKLRALIAQVKSPAAPPPPPAATYGDHISEQIDLTREYHHEQGVDRDIALDIDPEAPTPRRTAALRHAWLIAEKAAAGSPDTPINWELLTERYQQLLKFNQRYGKEEEEPDHHFAFNQTKEALAEARERIAELEPFETLYYELEQRWSESKNKADEQLHELRSLIESSADGDNFNTALDKYNATYREIDSLLVAPSPASNEEAATDESQHSDEIQRLRSVTSEQHQIISELTARLNQHEDSDEQFELIEQLQQELSKQVRLMQESETCIQQMEEELNYRNGELARLRADRKNAPDLRAELEAISSKADKQELLISDLKTENQRLSKEYESRQKEAAAQSEETEDMLIQTQTELFELQAKYNELNEKFLALNPQDKSAGPK